MLLEEHTGPCRYSGLNALLRAPGNRWQRFDLLRNGIILGEHFQDVLPCLRCVSIHMNFAITARPSEKTGGRTVAVTLTLH